MAEAGQRSVGRLTDLPDESCRARSHTHTHKHTPEAGQRSVTLKRASMGLGHGPVPLNRQCTKQRISTRANRHDAVGDRVPWCAVDAGERHAGSSPSAQSQTTPAGHGACALPIRSLTFRARQLMQQLPRSGCTTFKMIEEAHGMPKMCAKSEARLSNFQCPEVCKRSRRVATNRAVHQHLLACRSVSPRSCCRAGSLRMHDNMLVLPAARRRIDKSSLAD